MATTGSVQRDFSRAIELLGKAMRGAIEEIESTSQFCATLEDSNDRLSGENSLFFSALQRIRVQAREVLDADYRDAAFFVDALEAIHMRADCVLRQFTEGGGESDANGSGESVA